MSHNTIYSVLAALPEEDKLFWGLAGKKNKEIAMLLEKGSLDLYEGRPVSEYPTEMNKFLIFYRHAKIRRLFHYLPIDVDVSEGCGAWQSDSTSKWKIVSTGFNRYLKKIIDFIGKNKKEEAFISMIMLCHFLQDQTAFFHSMEGEEGTSPWIFDELMDPAGQSPVPFMNEFTPDFSMDYYRPYLLGTGREEVSFNLYQKYRITKRKNRQMLFPLIRASYDKNKNEEMAIREKIGKRTAELTADLFYTIAKICMRNYNKKEVSKFDRIYLSDLVPINYPRHLSRPYEFNGIIKDHALNNAGNQSPLALKINGMKVVFKHGMGMGCHKLAVLTYHIPESLFKHLSGYIGLYYPSCNDGNLAFEILSGKKVLLSKVLNKKKPSCRINCDISKGGMLTFKFKSLSTWSNPANNLVIADPVLSK